MAEVKKEIYGSRPSVLVKKLKENNIDFIQNLWFITCNRAINQNIGTRYLVIIESIDDEVDLKIFNDFIPVYRFAFHNGKYFIKNLRNDEVTSFTNKGEFKDWIITTTDCEFRRGYALGSPNATEFSRFFRENMGSGFTLTDVDFYITDKSVFIEEKTFIQDGLGFLGVGQCFSFGEITNDICPNIDFHIILNDSDDFYLVDFNSIDSNRRNSSTKWGNMVEFDLGEKYSIDEIIRKFK